jgi:group I intron endonuclease
MNNYCVYYHRNVLNDKLYIGISKDINKRWSANGNQYKECKFFYRAIQKYGWDNFEHVILIENISKEIACVVEKELIEKYKTQNKEFGYNLASGGFGGCTSKGQKHFLSKKVFQYGLDGTFIREWENAQRASEELNICVSDIHTMCRGENGIKKAGNYMWSYTKVNSMQPYVRETSSKKSIIQLDKNFNVIKKYKNISYINENEYTKDNVVECCRLNKQYTHKGYFWVYEEDFNDKHISRIKERLSGKHRKPTGKIINLYDLSYNLLNSFSNAREAEEKTGFNRHTIQAYCKRPEMNNGIHTGYIWKYA